MESSAGPRLGLGAVSASVRNLFVREITGVDFWFFF
jgi:hypothetical protein